MYRKISNSASKILKNDKLTKKLKITKYINYNFLKLITKLIKKVLIMDINHILIFINYLITILVLEILYFQFIINI